MLISDQNGRRIDIINYWFSGIYLYGWPLKKILGTTCFHINYKANLIHYKTKFLG